MNSSRSQKKAQQDRPVLYSSTARYAIRAFVHLTQMPKVGFATNKEIARAEDLPARHLSKMVQYFARTGVLKSVKGPTGGFALDLDAGEIRLLDIV